MDAKSAKQPYVHPVNGVVKGNIPKWVKGSLFRIGPAKFEVGSDHYKHMFDGLGMVQRYFFNDGEVTFNSQYVHSNTYMKNMVANRIVMSEFGTVALPDPCQSIFSRFSTKFDTELTDNTNVCVYPIGDELFSATETNVIHRINKQDLSTISSVRLNKVVAIHRATAHQHIDPLTGIVHLLGFINNPPAYALITLPPIKKEESQELNNKYDMEILLAETRIVAKVSARWKLNPSYFHSFGITENYYILLECPLTLNVVELLKSKILNLSFANSIKWWPDEKTKIHIIDRKTGESVNNTYVTDALFTFHHINAYEDDGHVIVDYSAYEDGSVIIDTYRENLQKKEKAIFHMATAKRLVIPLNVNLETEENVNLNKIEGTTSTAMIIQKTKTNATIYCSQEELAPQKYIELPTINYNAYNGKKYRYMYGVGRGKLVKIDAINKQSLEWRSEEPKATVGEAIFLPNPNANENNQDDEDLGVLLCPVIYDDDKVEYKRYQSLVIIDAMTMKEIGRAEFKSVSIPGTFHGVFLNNH